MRASVEGHRWGDGATRLDAAIRVNGVLALAVLTLLVGLAAPSSAEPLEGVEAQVEVYKATAEAASCDVDWAVLGGIAGFVSDHGRMFQPPPAVPLTQVEAIEAVSRDVESAAPVPIRGDQLDGEDGRLLITDSDQGEVDGDDEYDRAVGPFQFIPTTWAYYATDANGDGVADPDNLEDSAAAAAQLLCDLDVDENPTAALTGYFGTDTWNERAQKAAAELRSFDARRTATAQGAVLLSVDATNVELVSVNGIRVNAQIGDAVQAMLNAAADDGIVLQGWGWRSHQRQIELRAAHCADIWETPASQCSPPTAKPGTSLHETGQAIDFYIGTPPNAVALTRSSPEFLWLEANAASFGFYNLPSEPWHWSTTGG